MCLKTILTSHLANAIAGNPSTALTLWPESCPPCVTLEVPWGRFSEVDGWWTLEEEACKLMRYEIQLAEQFLGSEE